MGSQSSWPIHTHPQFIRINYLQFASFNHNVSDSLNQGHLEKVTLILLKQIYLDSWFMNSLRPHPTLFSCFLRQWLHGGLGSSRRGLRISWARDRHVNCASKNVVYRQFCLCRIKVVIYQRVRTQTKPIDVNSCKFDNTAITGICNCRSFGLQWPCRKVNPSSMPLAMPSDHPLLHIDWGSFPGSKLLKTFPNYGRTGRLYTGKWAGSRTYIAID